MQLKNGTFHYAIEAKTSQDNATPNAEVGAVNRFTHIWSYPSLDARNESREKAVAAGVWPPSAVAKKEGMPDAVLTAQENKIVMPSAFSPLQ